MFQAAADVHIEIPDKLIVPEVSFKKMIDEGG
jgi:hypothetical protein